MGTCSLVKPHWLWGVWQFKDSLFPASSVCCSPMPSRLYSQDHSPWLTLWCIMPTFCHITTGGSTRDSLFWQTEKTESRWPALLPGTLGNPADGNTFLYFLPGYCLYSLVPISPCFCSFYLFFFFWLMYQLTHGSLYIQFLTYSDGEKYRFLCYL